MPHLPHSIELHDSVVESVRTEGGTTIIALRPAYVHRGGKGWLQEVDLVVFGSAVELATLPCPASISDGILVTASGPYHNLLMLPLDDGGPVRLDIQSTSAEVLRVKGTAIRANTLAEPVFVENVA